MTSHRLGGADHRVAPEGAGSSPAGSIWPKTNSKAKLRSMLKERDRQLSDWDRAGRYRDYLGTAVYRMIMNKRDTERRLIREKLKSLGRT